MQDETVNKCLLEVDKFIPEMCLRQLGFTYDFYASFANNKEWVQKSKKYCVVKHLILLKILNMMEIKEVMLEWFIDKYFDKKTVDGPAGTLNKSTVKNENMSNKELGEELHKPIIRKLKETKSILIFHR